MKIHLITGATGFVGKYLTDALLRKGETVWVVVRSLNKISAHTRANEAFRNYSSDWPNTFKVIHGDIMIEDLGISSSIIKELVNNEVVFWHLAANLSFASANTADAQKTNSTGTMYVVNFANKVAKSFMHMSTAYVCGNSPSFKERDLDIGQTFRNHYEKSKFAGEKYVHENCKLPYIVFRPSVIIGDAYRGKAEGCTFGYYRYVFMFHFFKRQILKALEKKGIVALILKMFGTRYDRENDTLRTPWLILPYPRGGLVDLVPINYVVESMIYLYEKKFNAITVHLTHHNPTAFHFLLASVLHDFGFRRMKFVQVPPWLYRGIVYSLYYSAVPVRAYVKSVIWYLPYFMRQCKFERSVVKRYPQDPSEISRELISKVNIYAKENIMEHIHV